MSAIILVGLATVFFAMGIFFVFEKESKWVNLLLALGSLHFVGAIIVWEIGRIATGTYC